MTKGMCPVSLHERAVPASSDVSGTPTPPIHYWHLWEAFLAFSQFPVNDIIVTRIDYKVRYKKFIQSWRWPKG